MMIAVFCQEYSLMKNNGYAYAFEFYRVLAKKNKIKVIVPQVKPFFKEKVVHLDNNITAYYTAASEENYVRNNGIKNIFDFAAVAHKDVVFVKTIAEIINDVDVVICDSFLWVHFVYNAFKHKYIILRSLDIEHDKIEQVYASNPALSNEEKVSREQYKKQICTLECEAYNVAYRCLALTETDARRLSHLYDVPLYRFNVVPICVLHMNLYRNFLPLKRQTNGHIINAVLVGYLAYDAWHFVDTVFDLANKFPDIIFHIIGKNYCSRSKSNVVIHGIVSEEEKMHIVFNCDFSLNIATQTYGMNVKMLDYMLCGCPIISTTQGVRGYNMEAMTHYYPCSLDSLEKDIEGFLNLSASQRSGLAFNAYNLLLKNHDYERYCDEIFRDIDIEEYKEKSIIKYDKVVVLGCGKALKHTLSFLDGIKALNVYLADNNTDLVGMEINGYEVHSPKWAFEKVNENIECRLLISTNVPLYLKELYVQALENIDDKSKIDIYFQEEINPSSIDYKKLGGSQYVE